MRQRGIKNENKWFKTLKRQITVGEGFVEKLFNKISKINLERVHKIIIISINQYILRYLRIKYSLSSKDKFKVASSKYVCICL